jgi:hypothetical protein
MSMSLNYLKDWLDTFPFKNQMSGNQMQKYNNALKFNKMGVKYHALLYNL